MEHSNSSAAHSSTDLQRFAEIRDRLAGLSSLKPTILIDTITGYHVVIFPSQAPEFFKTLPEAKSALSR